MESVGTVLCFAFLFFDLIIRQKKRLGLGLSCWSYNMHTQGVSKALYHKFCFFSPVAGETLIYHEGTVYTAVGRGF